MKIEYIETNQSYTKYLVDNRYAVYLHKCTNQNSVHDTTTDTDITGSNKALKMIIACYNVKNPVERLVR